MLKKVLIALVLLFSFSGIIFSQSNLSNWRENYYPLDTHIIVIDSISVVESSLQLTNSRGEAIDSSLFKIVGKSLHLDKNLVDKADSIKIRYRALQFDFNKTYTNLDSSKISPIGTAIYIGYDFDPYKNQKETNFINSEGLDYDGSFSRGFSFGNNQSLVLNSNFNLQLAGDLGDDLQILAAISDANIPIQAAGNTQRLQEFDKVFIQLKKGGNSIIAGDYELNKPAGYFMHYNKKLKGLSLNNISSLNENLEINSKGSFAISRGKYARNDIISQEGNQGPYKLEGNNGERFLIVLSGTEKVYIDGQVMTRGLEYDYVIDYDRAEITFTHHRLITKDSRIKVDFEYSDQNYLRTIYAFNTEIKHKNYSFYLNFYNEQDSKSTTGDLELDQSDIDILEASGDDPLKSLRSGIRFSEEGFLEDRVMYKKVYEPTIQDTILKYSTNPDSARYTASFSEVGPGNGSYSIDDAPGANGRVYKWVGENNGSYEPIIRLIAPEQKQMISLGTLIRPWKKAEIKAELSLSNLDLNRFSGVDNNDNFGYGGIFEYNDQIILGSKESKWTLRPKVAFERVQSSFNPLNPYRRAEFTRDWNLTNSEISDENIIISQLSIGNPKLGNVNLTYNGFFKESLYDGNKFILSYNYDLDDFKIILNIDNLSTNGFGETSNFFRPNFHISKKFKKLKNWSFGAHFEREKNQRKSIGSDDLNQLSFFYDQMTFSIKSNEDSPFIVGLSYNRRIDFAPVSLDFEKSTTANEISMDGLWNANSNSILNWNIVFRDLTINNAGLTNEEGKNTILGNLDYRFKILNGSLSGNTNYTVSSGQEVKREFVFQEVIAGEGNYIWIDADSNGIQSINEFEIAAFADEANYIKITVFNNEFVRTNRNSLSQSLRIEPSKFWKDRTQIQKKGSKRFLSRFSTLSSFRLDQKSMGDNIDQSLNPFSFNFNDTSLVSFNSLISNTLFINRGKPRFDWQFGNKINQSKILQINGYEQRKLNEYFTRIRWNIMSNTDFILKLTTGKRETDSELFDNRDFNINFSTIEPEINYRPNNSSRIKLKYQYDQKKNSLGVLQEESTGHDFGLEFTYLETRKSNFTASINYVNVTYNGEANSSLELAMLEGLKKGNNFLWGIDYTRRLANNIDLSLSYNGRKTGIANVVHVARAQVKASF